MINETKEFSVLEAAYLLGQNDQARVEFLSGRVLPVYCPDFTSALKLKRWIEQKWRVQVCVKFLSIVQLYHLSVANRRDGAEEQAQEQ